MSAISQRQVSLLEKRAQAIVDAEARVKVATRRAFPHGECSYDREWQEAVRARDAEYRASALMVARGFLALVSE